MVQIDKNTQISTLWLWCRKVGTENRLGHHHPSPEHRPEIGWDWTAGAPHQPASSRPQTPPQFLLSAGSLGHWNRCRMSTPREKEWKAAEALTLQPLATTVLQIVSCLCQNQRKKSSIQVPVTSLPGEHRCICLLAHRLRVRLSAFLCLLHHFPLVISPAPRSQ